MRRSIITIVGATAALSLTACGIAPEQSTSTPSSDYTQDADLVDDGGDAEPTEPTEPTEEPEPTEVGFGEPFVYEDGLTVTVDQLGTFTPNEWAAGGEGFASHVKFRVTVTNDTGAPFDPSLALSSVQSGTTEGDAVFDSDNGMGGSPMTSVLDGRSVSWVEGYGVDDPADLVIQVAPSFDHDAAIFTGGIQ